MRSQSNIFGVTLAAVLAMAGGAGAANHATALMKPVHQFIDSFNKGDTKGAAAANVSGGISIIDEVPPHHWVGATAFDDWAHALSADAAKMGDSKESVKVGVPSRADVTGDRGYLVVPAVFAYVEKGVAMREPAHMTFALQNGADGWKIAGWTWTGGKAAPAAAKKPAAPASAPAAAPAKK